jgi:peptidoglycan/LPS O-acetylase OafA/YrhL
MRIDIQVTRSFAEGSVILFHTEFSFIRSGFLGVDIFFVISGYLITKILFREIDKSMSVLLIRCWSRRARRLTPVSSFVHYARWHFLDTA